MQREEIELGSDDGMGGTSLKSLIVTLRKDGRVSLRGMSDMRHEGWGCYFPAGASNLATVEELEAALAEVLSNVGVDTFDRWEIAAELEPLAKKWDSALLAAFAQHLASEHEDDE